MSDLSWKAEGMERARAAGGVDLDLRRRPGFTGGMELRPVSNWPTGAWSSGESHPYADHDPLPDWLPPSRAKR